MKLVFTASLIISLVIARAQSYIVYFDFDRFDINPAEKQKLDSFLNAEKSLLISTQVELYGHCDAIGPDHYNQVLSDKRVVSVRKYLEEKGVSISENSGYGETRPLNDNATPELRNLNRRVEIRFTKKPNDGVTLKEKIADTAVTSGVNIVLRNINFVGGHHIFLPESQPMLAELLDAMLSFPKLVIRVEGHICCQPGPDDGIDLGTGQYNLSLARARAVRNYLVENGISPDRVSYIGLGHSQPLYPSPEKSEDEKTQNRRVEIKIIRK